MRSSFIFFFEQPEELCYNFIYFIQRIAMYKRVLLFFLSLTVFRGECFEYQDPLIDIGILTIGTWLAQSSKTEDHSIKTGWLMLSLLPALYDTVLYAGVSEKTALIIDSSCALSFCGLILFRVWFKHRQALLLDPALLL